VEEHSTLIILRLIEEAGDCAVVFPSLFPNFPIVSAIAVDLERFWSRDLRSSESRSLRSLRSLNLRSFRVRHIAQLD